MGRSRSSSPTETKVCDNPGKIVDEKIKVEVVEVRVIAWLALGLVISTVCASAWMRTLLDYIQGYRWDPMGNCIIEYGNDGYGVDYCRPPIDCEICKDVNVIDDVSVDNLSIEEFEEKYANSNRPVVVRNASLGWKAKRVINYEWLRKLYLSNDSVLTEEDEECWFNSYQTKEFKNRKSTFKVLGTTASLKSSKPWYVGWGVCHELLIEKFQRLHTPPAFLDPDLTTGQTMWIFLGSPGPGAHLHIDNIDSPSWQAQLAGVKTWYIAPPPECWWSCPGPVETTLYPGDIMVIHAGLWFHSTKVVGPDISVVLTSEFD